MATPTTQLTDLYEDIFEEIESVFSGHDDYIKFEYEYDGWHIEGCLRVETESHVEYDSYDCPGSEDIIKTECTLDDLEIIKDGENFCDEDPDAYDALFNYLQDRLCDEIDYDYTYESKYYPYDDED